MNPNLENEWLRRDIATPSIYYGYSMNPSTKDNDSLWSIKKVTTLGSVDTVSWNDNTVLLYNAVWNDRVETFTAPTASLSITYSVNVTSNSFGMSYSIINASWNDIKGINKYNVSITDQNGILYDSLGNPFSNNYTTTRLTNVQSSTNYTFKGVSSMTYSLTVDAVNAAGSTSSTVNITT